MMALVAPLGAAIGSTFLGHLSRTFMTIALVESSVVPGAYEFEHATFVAACSEVAKIYDRMGAFLGPAKKYMLTNLATISAGIAKRGGAIRTVQDAIRYDVSHGLTFGETGDRKGVSFGILWLVRALRFILLLLTNLIDPAHAASETKTCALEAYGLAIRPFHGRLLSFTFGAMMGQIPQRKKLLAALAKGPDQSANDAKPAGVGVDEALVYGEMRTFVAIFRPLVQTLHEYFRTHGLDDPWKA